MISHEQQLLLEFYYDGELEAAERAEVEALLERDPEARSYLACLRELTVAVATPLQAAAEAARFPPIADLAIEAVEHGEDDGIGDALRTALTARAASADFARLHARLSDEMKAVDAQRAHVQKVAGQFAAAPNLLDRLRALGGGWAFNLGLAAVALAIGFAFARSSQAPGDATAEAPTAAPTVINNYYLAAPRVDEVNSQAGYSARFSQGDDQDAVPVIWIAPTGEGAVPLPLPPGAKLPTAPRPSEGSAVPAPGSTL